MPNKKRLLHTLSINAIDRKAHAMPGIRHNPGCGIMNRFLSGLRSRALKNIELSRGVGIAESYGDCNRRVQLCADPSVAERRCKG